MPTLRTRVPGARIALLWLLMLVALLLSACDSSGTFLPIVWIKGTATPTLTATPTATATFTPTSTFTPTATATATATATSTSTPTPTATATSTPTATPTVPPLVLSLTIEPPTLKQGHTLLVNIEASRPVSLTGFLDGKLLHFAATPSGGWTVIGLNPYAEVRNYTLKVAGVDRYKQQQELTATIKAEAVNYGVDYLTIAPSLAPLLDPTVRQEEQKRLDKVLSQVSPLPLWKGPFIMPVQDILTSDYGSGRSYNGLPVSSFHGGVDIQGATGTPIKAANAGKVVWAEKTEVRGNLVILDHGLGVFTSYGHMSQFRVTVGQMVKQGEVIGLVGDTGLVTGPHLHWEVIVGGVPVLPLEWTEKSFP